jgi:D-beta-D-heptose 7-phosphate kinase/D-beta-D-heptose 1-phosphate adenosyltransferase
MLDHNLEGQCNKIANEGPIPVVNIKKESVSIGGCGNVVLNCISLGAKNIFLFSRIGDDENGGILEKLLPENIINNMIKCDTFTTITKTRIYADKKILARYDKENIVPMSNDQEINCIEQIKQIILNNRITSIIFSDYNKGFLTKSLCNAVIKLANNHNIPTIVDPKVDYTKYIGATVFKPNKSETKKIFDIDIDNISYEECHMQIQKYTNCLLSVITLSGDGISAYKDGMHVRVSEYTKDVIDVTGAGDIVCAILGTYYPYISDINLLIKIANHLASISVSHTGVYRITNNDLINTYKYIHETKHINLELLKTLNLNKTVFTNGCFDILHSAHIELFKFCKNLGDTVIVGLNSDESIKRIKGSSRPINNIIERIKMLNAIEYIDFIVVFDEDTPLELIKVIKPDYLIKGGDYTVDKIIGKDYAKKILIFNYIEGLSTTNIILKLK